jgi:hypothetical protein
MGIRGLSAADEAGLGGDEPKVLLVAIAPRLGNRQDALVDAGGLIIFGSNPFRGRHGGRLTEIQTLLTMRVANVPSATWRGRD